MGAPVNTVAAGGIAVVDITATLPNMGAPVSEALPGKGTAVTKVTNFGVPVTFESLTFVSLPTPPLAGLIGWWDASVTAGLSLAGSTVNSVADQSGGGMTLARMDPPTPTRNLPTYSATGLNGRPAIVFDGTNTQILGADVFPLGGGADMTAFCVCNMSSSSPANARIFNFVGQGQSRDWNNQWSFAVGRQVSNAVVVYSRNSLDHTATMTMNAPHRLIITVNAAGVKSIYVDGVATTVTGTGYGFAAPGPFCLGSTKYLPDNAASLTGAISEVGVTETYIDATTAASLDTYLKNKWGL